jgi:hypothetical protein
MRSIASLSLLSIGLFITPLQLIQAKPVDSLLSTQISTSEYSIVFAETDTKVDLLSSNREDLNKSLKKAQTYEENKYAQLLQQQKDEAERQAKEAEAAAKEAERQAVLAAEKAKADEAKRKEEALRKAQFTPAPTVTRTISGSKSDWMKSAGIPESEWQYVDFIVARESSWNPNAVNASSGACSLAQALPCSKIGGDWRDPVVALKWQYNYVNGRYGGYKGAYDFWLANNWY